MVVDRADSPEYHTPPIASPSPTLPPVENDIPLQVRVDLGAIPQVDSDEENRPACCTSG